MPTSGRDTLVLVVVMVGSVVVVVQVAVVGSVGYPVGDMVLTVGVLDMSVNSRTTAKAFKIFGNPKRVLLCNAFFDRHKRSKCFYRVV